MRTTFERLVIALDGLTDDEFFWEPVPGCWTVFRDDAGAWTYHYELPDPVPSPFTTIGWRLIHLALCKVMYHEWAFGPARLTWDTIACPHDAASGMTMLQEGHALLSEDLAGLVDHDLSLPVRTNWGERWPAWRIFWEMTAHDAQHGAEIGVVRDLYRLTDGGSAHLRG